MKKNNRFWVVTHGQKNSGPNPGMTAVGFKEIGALHKYIPAKPTLVIGGTGKRHSDVAKALDLTLEKRTCVFGGGDSLEKVDGEMVIRLTDGSTMKRPDNTSLEDMSPGTIKKAASLPNNAVICGGRPVMIMLGMEEKKTKSAAVYQVETDGEKITCIEELVAYGEIEIGAI